MRMITYSGGRRVEAVTGAILTGTSEPVGIQNGDLWINETDMTLNVYTGGVSYELGDLE